MILREIVNSDGATITSLLNRISREKEIPLSTLKLNCRILKELGLIENAKFLPVSITNQGRVVVEVLGE